MKDTYTLITERIIAELEAGTVPWHKPWTCAQPAISHTTGKAYSLLNQLLLGGRSGEYLTFNQAKKEGGCVRKGEKASMVVFWKWLTVEDKDTGEEKEVPFLRYFSVFHVDQCEGIMPRNIMEDPLPINPATANDTAEGIIAYHLHRSSVHLIRHESSEVFYEHGDAVVKQHLQSLLDAAQQGDTSITLKVSCLTRSTQQLSEIVNVIKQKRLRLVIFDSITVDCQTGQIDTMSQAFIQMSAVFAELELSIIRARVRSSMQNAKAKGKKIGRPRVTKEDIPTIFLRHYPEFLAGRLNVSELARVCGLSRPTVYRYLKLLE